MLSSGKNEKEEITCSLQKGKKIRRPDRCQNKVVQIVYGKLSHFSFSFFHDDGMGDPCRNIVVFVVSLHVYNRCFGAQQITCNPSNPTHVETVNAGVSIWFLLQNVSWWSFSWRVLFCTLLIRGILTFWLTCASQMYYPLTHYLWQVNLLHCVRFAGYIDVLGSLALLSQHSVYIRILVTFTQLQ